MTRWLPLVLLVLLAGCAEADSDTTATVGTQARAAATVFTVPAKLPPRAGARTGARAPASRAKDTKAAAKRTNAELARTKLAVAKAAAAATAPSSGAPSDAQMQKELAKALGVSDTGAVVDQAGMSSDGLATVPPGAPSKVAAIITAGNQVARAPYRYGGGHGGVTAEGTWVDSAYDCSGSVSFALASAGLLDRQMDSTSLESWGQPGPGKWVTVFANADHAFMVVAGLRFDTVERARTGTRWGLPPTSVSGFVLRHPAGL